MDRRRMRPNELKKNMICLGKQGENGAMALVFDCAEWLAEYPAGTIRLYVQTAGREEYYPPLGIEGTDRVYVINSEKATKTAGNGVIELLLIDSASGTTIKSATGYTTVRRSPSAGTEETDGEPGYVRYDAAQALTEEQKAQARSNIGAGTGSGNGEGTGEPGADGEDGGYYTPAVDASGNLTWSASKVDMPSVPSANIKGPAGRDGNDGVTGPQGLPGKDGRGIVNIERTGGDGSAGTVDTYTITYTDGTTSTYTVTNGKNGQNASGDGTLSVEIDETLSISGAAADAKMTGDRLNELKEANAAQDERLTTLEQAGGISSPLLGELKRVPIYPCAQIYLDGDTSTMTKDDAVMLGIRITDEYGNEFFAGKSETSWQGSGSLAYDNKNLSLKLKNPDGSKAKINVFPDYKASTYHCKCNFLDYSMSRNSVGARMALDFDDTVFPTTSPITVKAIPVIVWLNGAFNGCYTLGVKQDDSLYGMDSEANPLTEIVYRWSYEAFTAAYAEYRGEAEETDEIKAKIQTVIDFARNSNDSTFTAQVENHLDLNNLINYWLYADITCATDNMTNNFTLATWDGAKWYACWYDLDIIFGLLKDANNSRHPNKPTTVMINVEDTKTNPIWAKLYKLYFDRIKERYWVLRESGIANATYIVDKFRTFQTKWSERNIEKDRAKWTTRPNKTADIDSMHAWIVSRLAYLDEVYGMSVTTSGSYFTLSNSASKVGKGASYTTQLVPSAGYAIDTVTVTMGGVDITADVYDAATNTITIDSVTGDIVITATVVQGETYPDNITVDGGVMTITTLANIPTRNGGILTIS